MNHDTSFFTRNFALDSAMLERLMTTALARGGDYCDLFFQQRSGSVLALEDNEVNRAYHSVSLGVGIRVVQGDATGFAFCEELEEPAMQQAAAVAAAIARHGASVAPQRIVPRAVTNLYPIERPWAEVSVEEKLPLLARVNERAFAADPRVCKVRLRFTDSESHVLVVTSTGQQVYDYRPMTVLGVSCVAEANGRREENGHSMGGRYGIDYFSAERLAHAADEAVARTTLLFEAVRPEAGQLPVVLAAGSSGILLHEAIGHGMEADFNRKGISIYADRVGQAIAPPFVSIVDDGTLPHVRGTINVDDEGNPTQRTVLVEQGVLRTFMHDWISAKHYGVAPTGNGRRESFRHVPLPRMRTTYMLAGPHEKEEIIRSVQRGIYAATFTNGQVQIGAGDFTFYVKTGYLIEGGKLTAPIKDVNLIGNGPSVLQDVVMVGNDLVIDEGGWTCGKEGQSVPVAQGLPTVKIGAMTVGGLSR